MGCAANKHKQEVAPLEVNGAGQGKIEKPVTVSPIDGVPSHKADGVEAKVEDHDTFGSSCAPPAGVRGGSQLLGGPPVGLEDVPGTPSTHGRIVRPEVTLVSGAVYIGQWKGNKRDGEGIITWKNGSTYEGQFSNDCCSGNGDWHDSTNNSYSGQWRNGVVHGIGEYINKDGSKYNGSWNEDAKHGDGIETWTDGTTYEGQFKDGDKHGEGILSFPDGSTYYGQFQKDEMSGQGTYRWKNDRIYQGMWKTSQMHGQGTYKWPDGQFTKYVGNFSEGKKHGKGRLFYQDGRIYDGEFKNGLQDGKGNEIWPSGEKRTGEWKNGRHIKWNQKIDFELQAAKTADEAEEQYETSVFSNPDAYTGYFKKRIKERAHLSTGILANKEGAKTATAE